MLPLLVVLQVQLLLSSGVASVWQVSTPAIQQLLQQAQPTAAVKALAELASSAVPVKDLAKALQQQLEGLTTAAAGPAAAASTQRCSVRAYPLGWLVVMFAGGDTVEFPLCLLPATAATYKNKQ
jgi:hypothetical protein